MAETVAYEEGQEAAELDWVTEQSCPYPALSREYLAWHKGFYDARNPHDDARCGREA